MVHLARHFTSLGNEEKASSESVKGGIDLSKSVCIEPKLYKTHPNDSRISECKDGLADTVSARYGTGGGNTPLVEQTKNEDIDVLDDQGGNADFMHVYKNVTGTLRSKSHVPMIVQKTETFAATDYSGFTTSQKGLATLKAKGGVLGGGSENLVLQWLTMTEKESIVRKLTPIECERLQGFADDYTKIPYRGKKENDCPDSPRYKAIGNSMAVPVMKWIGKRIQFLEDKLHGRSL